MTPENRHGARIKAFFPAADSVLMHTEDPCRRTQAKPLTAYTQHTSHFAQRRLDLLHRCAVGLGENRRTALTTKHLITKHLITKQQTSTAVFRLENHFNV